MVDWVHSSDKDILLKAFSTGETIHMATYTLFHLLIAIHLKKKN